MYEILILAIMVIAFLLMIGVIKSSTAFNLIGLIIFFILIIPFISSYVKGVEFWVLLAITFIFILLVIQWLTGLIFGKSVGDRVIASIITRIIFLPLKLVIKFISNLFGKKNI